jgi:hypothetical protein
VPPRKTKKHQAPRLCVSDFDDADQLAAKIDVILRADTELRKWGRRIRNLQDELRDAVGNDSFGVYLRLEEEVIARGVRAIDVVTAWAFREGMRVGQPDTGRRRGP